VPVPLRRAKGYFCTAGTGFLRAGEMNSLRFLGLSALVLSASILPWCILMGATFPLMMAFLRQEGYPDTLSFGFLYTANVLGALCGTVSTAVVLIERYGFQATLTLAVAST